MRSWNQKQFDICSWKSLKQLFHYQKCCWTFCPLTNWLTIAKNIDENDTSYEIMSRLSQGLMIKLSRAYLTAQQLYPALDSLCRLGFFNVLQGLIQQHISCRGIWLEDHLGKQTQTYFNLNDWLQCISLTRRLRSRMIESLQYIMCFSAQGLVIGSRKRLDVFQQLNTCH